MKRLANVFLVFLTFSGLVHAADDTHAHTYDVWAEAVGTTMDGLLASPGMVPGYQTRRFALFPDGTIKDGPVSVVATGQQALWREVTKILHSAPAEPAMVEGPDSDICAAGSARAPKSFLRIKAGQRRAELTIKRSVSLRAIIDSVATHGPMVRTCASVRYDAAARAILEFLTSTARP